MERPTHSDPGLQPERTALAWTRTTLSLVIVLGLMGKLLLVYRQPVAPALVVVTVMVAGLLTDTARRLNRSVLAINHGVLPLATNSVLLVGLGVTLLGAVVLASMLG